MIVNLKLTCRNCGKTRFVEVEEKDLNEYNNDPNRRCVQDIFPYLSKGDREILISGICGLCFDQLFCSYD